MRGTSSDDSFADSLELARFWHIEPVDRLADRLVGRLFGSLVGRLVGRLCGSCLVGSSMVSPKDNATKSSKMIDGNDFICRRILFYVRFKSYI